MNIFVNTITNVKINIMIALTDYRGDKILVHPEEVKIVREFSDTRYPSIKSVVTFQDGIILESGMSCDRIKSLITQDTLVYKGFLGIYTWIEGEHQFCGKIDEIDDLVTFTGKTIVDLVDSFKESVNDYIELSREVGK